jgi:hypothetical protein
MNLPIVYIRWEDHFEATDWTDLAAHKPEAYINTTVGFLVKKDRKHYVVARTLTPDGMGDGVMNIMKKNVVEFKVIQA